MNLNKQKHTTTQTNNDVISALKQGQVIAYPTEAVFGLGCDPFNEQAVKKLLALKYRDVDKGLILIAADFKQIGNLIAPMTTNIINKALLAWPGPVTWVFPASKKVPSWIKGTHDSVALRVTAHPIAREICEKFQGPIVSTSANIENKPVAKNIETVSEYFGNQVIIINGELGSLEQPTKIIDVLTNKVLRYTQSD